jgi:hypothetical protein
MTGGIVSTSWATGASSLTSIEQTGSSSAHISGGRISFTIPERSTHRLVRLADDAQLEVTGGEFDLPSADETLNPSSRIFELSDNSQLTVSGGTYASVNKLHVDLVASDTSLATIFGGNFNHPMFEPIQATEGQITGTLQDGNDFSWTFSRAPGATIILVPEPSGMLLVLAALGMMWSYLRDHHGERRIPRRRELQ